jgi:ribosomal-protein-alanine N-acetyltransferase
VEDKFLIRPMDFDDLEEIVWLDGQCFPDPWSLDTFVYEITKNNLASYVVIVDQENNKIAGYSGMWIVLEEAQITNIAVLGEYRGLGLGEALMTRQLKDSIIAGANKMTLEARISNRVWRFLL